MTLACGTDNRAVDDGGWQTTINGRGECEWRPPPDLDHGQSRINYYHRPEALLTTTRRRARSRTDTAKTQTTQRYRRQATSNSTPPRHPADPNHLTTKPPEP